LIVDDDQTFRAALLLTVVVMLPVAVCCRLRSQATRETLDRRQEGLFILMTLRPLGIGLWLAVVAYLVKPASMVWSSLPLPSLLRWIGVGVCVMADGLLMWTLLRLGKNLTDTVVTRREHTLVTRGPYRFVRHPFYDSAALFVLGLSLAAANWFMFVAGGLVIALLVIRVRTEEEHLLARFGDPYRAYVERTGRFLPRLR
jgi:protein-S-isoprenylcysteine O-methyltransferase Ste14